jgi:hypothetical protein
MASLSAPPAKPTGPEYSLHGTVLNRTKGPEFHAAFWAAAGFVACVGANRMMNRPAMRCEWLVLID